jgi:natural product precursor
MKAKKINKKLTLNKQTVADLKKEELKAINGGAPTNVVCGGTFLTICCPEPVSYVGC